MTTHTNKAWLTRYQLGKYPLVAVKAGQLFAQLLSFHFVASIGQSLIIDRLSAEQGDLIGLVASLTLWLLLAAFALLMQKKVESKIALNLLADVRKKQARLEYSLIRKHSLIFWQQIERVHILNVAKFNSLFVPQMMLAALAPVIALCMAFSLNWFVGLILLMSLPVVPLFMVLLGKGAASVHRLHFVELERLGAMFLDRIKALSLIQIANIETREQTRLKAASERLNERTMSVVRIAFLSNTLLDFYATLATALVAVFIGFSLLGELSIGPEFSLYSGLLLLMVVPLTLSEMKRLGAMYHLKAQSTAAAEIIEPILAHKSSVRNNQSFTGFSCDHWSMSTPNLQGQHLAISTRDKIWLQGESGSGKTSMLEALAGFRQSSAGIEAKIAFLQQHNRLKQGSLRENLVLGHGIDDAKLWQVLTQVELNQWAREQGGLDTVFTENSQISGGQMQRLALARVLLSDADVVLLDEPTAHLTQRQHARLCRIIEQALSEHTLIWASHKSLDISFFNQIWRIDSTGKINTGVQHG